VGTTAIDSSDESFVARGGPDLLLSFRGAVPPVVLRADALVLAIVEGQTQELAGDGRWKWEGKRSNRLATRAFNEACHVNLSSISSYIYLYWLITNAKTIVYCITIIKKKFWGTNSRWRGARDWNMCETILKTDLSRLCLSKQITEGGFVFQWREPGRGGER
jgi:hypothetical protein